MVVQVHEDKVQLERLPLSIATPVAQSPGGSKFSSQRRLLVCVVPGPTQIGIMSHFVCVAGRSRADSKEQTLLRASALFGESEFASLILGGILGKAILRL